MKKTAVVLLAEGFEEVEAVTPVDYLRRAGITVTVAAVGESLAVTGARGITVTADVLLGDLDPGGTGWDAVVIPGGIPGADNIAASPAALAVISSAAAAGKMVCAICASPVVVLAPLGLLAGREFCCYPGLESRVNDGKFRDRPVTVDGNIVTSRGAGTTGLFSVEIIAGLLGRAEADRVASAVLL